MCPALASEFFTTSATFCTLTSPKFCQFFSKRMNLDPSSVSSIWECVMLLQSCLILCNPTDCSPLGSSVHGTSQARIFLQGIFPAQGLNLYLLHWQEDSLLRATREAHGSYSPMKCFSSIVKVESQNDSDSWTAAHQAPLSMGLPRQECWSGVPSTHKHNSYGKSLIKN